MATFDYNKPKATAERLIKRFGRTVDLVRQSETPQNANQPWKGPAQAAPAIQTLTVPAIQLLPNQVRIFGLAALGESGKLDGLLSISEYVYIVFQGEEDLRKFTFVRDGAIDYQIEATQALKPADVTILGYIGVRR